jgi:hypothetical protein
MQQAIPTIRRILRRKLPIDTVSLWMEARSHGRGPAKWPGSFCVWGTARMTMPAIPADYFDAFIAEQLAKPQPVEDDNQVIVHAYED